MNVLLRLNPYVRHTPWGGNVLARAYRYDTAAGAVGEVLDASCLPDMPSIVAGGAFAGSKLGDVFKNHGPAMLGSDFRAFGGEFPFLVKRIDAGQDLSLQVHPNDALARRLEKAPCGKSEAWIVLDAEPGAAVLLGTKPGTTRDDLRRAAAVKRLTDFMIRVPVAAGDVLPVPAGCPHSIGRGIVIFEAQQSVDLTYRLYDWDRPDKTGKLRELHLEKGLEVVDTELRPSKVEPAKLEDRAGFRRFRMVRMPQFEMQKWEISGTVEVPTGRIVLLHGVRGSVRVAGGTSPAERLGVGDSILVPAAVASVTLSVDAPAEVFVVIPVAANDPKA